MNSALRTVGGWIEATYEPVTITTLVLALIGFLYSFYKGMLHVILWRYNRQVEAPNILMLGPLVWFIVTSIAHAEIIQQGFYGWRAWIVLLGTLFNIFLVWYNEVPTPEQIIANERLR